MDLIRLDQEACRVFADVKREERPDVELEILLSRTEKKSIRVNRVKRPKIGDLVGQLNAVIFSIVDIEMVKGEPSERRRFLNLEISQISPQYIYNYARYKKVLEQRNKVLKDAKNRIGDLSMLGVLDQQLVAYGSVLTEKRLIFSRRLSEIAGPIYEQLSAGREKLVVQYQPNLDVKDAQSQEDIHSAFAQKLAKSRDNELVRGTTTSGPHRDDLSFVVNGLEVRNFGSQGQQRTAALAVKLAEIQLIEESAGEAPIALLDDVTAELDEERRAHVFDLTFGRCQTFVTTTTLKDLDQSVVSQSNIFSVEAGEITRK
jgi:DNA replication and repair protein RecF